jgi:opacity protein-like surface antigen
MSMKNRALAIFLLLAASQAQATHSFQEGFYLGGALGAGFGHADWDGVSAVSAANSESGALTVFESWTPEGENAVTELAGRAMIGYQFVQKPLYLAAEIGGTFANEYIFELNNTENFEVTFNDFLWISVLDVHAKLYDKVTLGSSEFNLDLKPGWLFKNNFLVYARLGLAVNELTIENSGTWTNLSSSYYDPPPPPLIVSDSSKESKTAYGIRLGLGAEYLLMQHLGLTLDYTYTDYGRISTIAQAGNSDFDYQTNIDGYDAPDVGIFTQTLMLGLLYHW